MQHLVPPSFLLNPSAAAEHLKHLPAHPALMTSPATSLFGLEHLLSHPHLLPPAAAVRPTLYPAYPPVMPPADIFGE